MINYTYFMQTFELYIISECKKNSQGGYDPISKEDKKKYKTADLITLPVEGTNCGNCEYYQDKEGGWCNHPNLQLHVTKKMCCIWWDHKNVIRKF